MKMLLSQDEVTSDKPGDNCQTPLHWTTKDGHKGVVAPLQPTVDNLTPLAWRKVEEL